MFDKLRKRIMLLNLGLTSLIMFAAFAAIYLVNAGSLRIEANRKLSDMGRMSFSDYARNDVLPTAYELSFMLLVDGEGGLIDAHAPGGYPDSAGFAQAAAFAWASKGTDDFKYYNSYWRFYTYGDEDGLYHISFLEVTSDKSTLSRLLLTLVLIGAVTLAAIWALSAFFAKRAIRPVAEAWERQKRFVADASHELKTPLMTILANCDVLEANEEESVKSQRMWIESIESGADRMGRLIANLLTLARIEGHIEGRIEGMSAQEEKRYFQIDTLIGEVIRSMDASVQAKHLIVRIADIPDRKFYGCEDLIRQIFTVFYDNALKYSDAGGTIDVRFALQKKQAVLSVRNTGMGIAPKDLPNIFDRFYRADAARNTDDFSYGLGLSIARGAAERMGGQLSARSALGEWAEFRLCFKHF